MNMQTVKKFVKDLLTEKFGEAYCPIRVFAFCLSIPTLLFFTIGYSLQILHGHLDVSNMASTFATLSAGFAAFGVSVTIKGFQEVQ